MERLDKHFKAITRAAFERHGFAHAEILNQWQSIAGDKLARSAAPLRIIWPGQRPSPHKSGGTLIVKVDPAMALDLQYQTPQMIERINGYFGYAAIAAIRILRRPSGPSDPPAGPAEAEHDATEPPPVQISGISDERLRAALLKLAAGRRRQRGTS
jgi:hypothetical protein